MTKKENFSTIYKYWGIFLICVGAIISSLSAIGLYHDCINNLGFVLSIDLGISSLVTGCLIVHLSSWSTSISKSKHSDFPAAGN